MVGVCDFRNFGEFAACRFSSEGQVLHGQERDATVREQIYLILCNVGVWRMRSFGCIALDEVSRKAQQNLLFSPDNWGSETP